MEENESPQTGINRRQLLKRSAIVGGALVWATPVVQSLGGTALAATNSPGGTGAPSYVFVFYKCANPEAVGGCDYYSVKYDKDSKTSSCGASPTLLSGDVATFGSGTCNGVKVDSTSISGVTACVQDLTCWDGFVTQWDSMGATPQTSCPDATPNWTSTSLEITVGTDCQIVGWFLHDGSCKSVSPGGKCRWPGDSETTTNPVGPPVPTSAGGTFDFYKCS